MRLGPRTACWRINLSDLYDVAATPIEPTPRDPAMALVTARLLRPVMSMAKPLDLWRWFGGGRSVYRYRRIIMPPPGLLLWVIFERCDWLIERSLVVFR